MAPQVRRVPRGPRGQLGPRGRTAFRVLWARQEALAFKDPQGPVGLWVTRGSLAPMGGQGQRGSRAPMVPPGLRGYWVSKDQAVSKPMILGPVASFIEIYVNFYSFILTF